MTGKQISGKEVSPEINPSIYGQLLFDKGTKNINGDIKVFFNKWC
jgi:hypothetical protein